MSQKLLAAAHHNLRISRRIRGRPHHVQSNSISCPIVHTRVESEQQHMTSYQATWSFCNVDIVYFLDPAESECEC